MKIFPKCNCAYHIIISKHDQQWIEFRSLDLHHHLLMVAFDSDLVVGLTKSMFSVLLLIHTLPNMQIIYNILWTRTLQHPFNN